MKAECKAKQERRFRGRRFRPYGLPTATINSEPTAAAQQGRYQGLQQQGRYQGNRRPGNCFRCGTQGHWRKECMAVNPDIQADINAKISIPMFSFSDGQHKLAKENVIEGGSIQSLQGSGKNLSSDNTL